MVNRYTLRMLMASLMLAASLSGGCGLDDKGSPSGQQGSGREGERPLQPEEVTGEEVMREVREALDATGKYLDTKKEEALAELDRRMGAVEADLDRAQRRVEEARERGRKAADDTYEALEEKQRDARLRMEEFKRSSGEMKDEAARRLDRALRELEEAYRDFWGESPTGEKR